MIPLLSLASEFQMGETSTPQTFPLIKTSLLRRSQPFTPKRVFLRHFARQLFTNISPHMHRLGWNVEHSGRNSSDTPSPQDPLLLEIATLLFSIQYARG